MVFDSQMAHAVVRTPAPGAGRPPQAQIYSDFYICPALDYMVAAAFPGGSSYFSRSHTSNV
eukprot:5500503-Pyramimonas_sp.AAC.1